VLHETHPTIPGLSGNGQEDAQEDHKALAILERLCDPHDHPEEEDYPLREFTVKGKLYCFTPGGYLYRGKPGTEEVRDFFCGYLPA
jgi:hypothetical protein